MTKVGLKTVSAAFVLLGVAASRPARAVDATNLLAPSALETAVADNPLIAVRRASGGTAVCTIRAKGVSWDCSLGAPPGGVATGPSLTAMPFLGNPTSMKWRFVFVRSGNGGLYERHIDLFGNTTTWTPWSTSTLGALPAGAVANSALVASHGMQAISVAVRDTANRVWVNRAGIGANDALPTFGGWVQVVQADNTSSAPAPALSDWGAYVFALGPTTRVRYTMCQFPSCFQTWSFMPNTTQTFNEGIQTYSYNDPLSNSPYVRIAGTKTGSVYFATMDMSSLVSSGFGQYLPPPTTAADSAPAVVRYGTSTSAMIVVHLNDQKYGMLDIATLTWAELPLLQ